MTHYVFWAYNNSCSSFYDGYIGLSNDPKDLFEELKSKGTVPSDSKLKVLFEAPARRPCLDYAKQLRRSSGMTSWNHTCEETTEYKQELAQTYTDEFDQKSANNTI